MSRLRILLLAIAGLSCISVLCAAFGVGWWPLEPLTAFLVQSTLALIVITFHAFRNRFYACGFALTVVALIGLVKLFPFAINERIPDTFSSCCVYLKVGHANLFSHGLGITRISRWSEEKNIEILELTELPDEASRIAQAFPQYPYMLAGEQQGRRKTVIFSKYPIEKIETGADAVLAAAAHVGNGISVTIVTTHPTVAVSPHHMKRRDMAISKAFQEAEKHPNAIVIGDFNAAPWSPVLAEAARRHDFTRSSGGVFGNTWITPLPVLGLPIDHVFASYEVGIYKSAVGPFIFSDHWPIYATIAVQKD